MEMIFTPNEVAALLKLPPKRVYKELEYQIIPSTSYAPRLTFPALIYLFLLKEINFEFSIPFRVSLYQRLVKAWEEKATFFEVAKFLVLQLDQVNEELSGLIKQFNNWKSELITDTNILGGETVFPQSRLSVRRIGNLLNRGETLENILEDYPFLSQEDLKFAQLFVNAYPLQGRPKKDEVFN
ncbi:DUF433 domain-containing protein [Cyanobacterium sp. Dongsha4]|uniref:DUF433 domain-containing protein n=1 Tax=Cyanobacterium sp. DS4 TaxID=2878255 RepID=UPI002E81E6DC|nr:DUF433 domain-containing protein [Cyanobacterium sp. Dongsha4]WVL00249.1 DUF433 domain-containing protein [Cyanobacterium sp. Dongsha4]